MDKAIIFRPFGFLGFHFCTRVLENGIEILGIELENQQKHDSLIEEKRMEIGRNANFNEVSSLNEVQDTITEKCETVTIIDLYDYFLLNTQSEILHVERKLHDMQAYTSKKIILMPIQMLLDNNMKRKSSFLKNVINENEEYQIYYLPTVYGPWQPNYFTFQQYLLNKPDKAISDWEYEEDALYIDDVIEHVLSHSRESNKEFLLKNKEPNSWSRCAEYLSIPNKKKNLFKFEFDGTVEFINSKRIYTEGLENQRNHNQLIYG